MEFSINLDQSDFKRLIDQSPSGDSSSSSFAYQSKSVMNLLVQMNLHSNLILPGTLDVGQLLARPSIVKLIDKFIDGCMEGDSSFRKNATKSVDYRNRGNREFGRRNMTQAAYLYTMAIVYAPNVAETDYVPKGNVTEELSLAFGNRSAVFFELGQHGACLEDIEHALATGYPRSKLSKLLLRKIECLIGLTRFGAAKSAWEHFVETIGTEASDVRALKIRLQLLDIKKDDDNQNKQDKQISLPSTNSMIPVIDYLQRTGRYKPSPDLAALSAKLEPRFSASKGRHLVASVDIEPGDILMVESPYSSTLKAGYDFHYCHHCCRRLENDFKPKIGDVQGQLCINGALVPCTSCTRVLYCSIVCRTQSWFLYHQFECALQPVLCQLAREPHTLDGNLALRILLSTGLDVTQKVATRNQKEEYEQSIPVFGFDAESDYEQVYRLVNHREKVSPYELGACVNIAAILVQLTKKCAFVRTAEQAKLAGTILLRHLLQLHVTTHAIPSSKRTERCSFNGFDIASGVYPITSCLLNHSCEPNTVPTWYHGNLMIQRASSRIVAGTEVTASYGARFELEDRAERQKTLLNQYRFVCDCSRCVLEGRDGLDGKYLPIGCQKCGRPLTRESSSSITFHCPRSSCASTMKLSDMKRAYTQFESKLTTLSNLVESHQRLGGSGGFCTLAQFAEWERQLSTLSSVNGMGNYHKLGILYNVLADHYEHSIYPGTARKARLAFERFCQIKEVAGGISPYLYRHIVRLVKLCADERIYPDFKARDKQDHRRGLKRAIKILRLFSLADLQHDNGPDLLVDDASFLWDKHRQLVKTLDGLK